MQKRNNYGYTISDKVRLCNRRSPWLSQLPLSQSPPSTARTRGGFPFDPSNPYGFSPDRLAAMDDAATGRNLSGPYRTVKEAMAALDEE